MSAPPASTPAYPAPKSSTTAAPTAGPPPPPPPTQPTSWMTAPAPIVRLFKTFPLATYAANALPASTPPVSDALASLFVFAEAPGRMSYNPTCLKWQTYLRFAGLPFQSIPSTNHASPTGALPFLLPAASGVAVPATSLASFAARAAPTPTPTPVRASPSPTYPALLDAAVRPAWLYALYLCAANAPLLRRLYIAPTSRSPAVQSASLAALRRAADAEVRALTRADVAVPEALFGEARAALAALDARVAQSPSGWFLGEECPSELDAAVFAYVHLLLDESLVWGDDTLPCAVASFMGLVQHHDRILKRFWDKEEWRVLS